jgi:hypothetical protein
MVDQIVFFYNMHVGEAMYHLATDPIVKAFIKEKTERKATFFKDKDLERMLKGAKWSEVQDLLKDAPQVIKLKANKKFNFKEIFIHERNWTGSASKEQLEPQNIKVFRANAGLLLQNKISQLLFKTIKPF